MNYENRIAKLETAANARRQTIVWLDWEYGPDGHVTGARFQGQGMVREPGETVEQLRNRVRAAAKNCQLVSWMILDPTDAQP